MLTLPEVQMHDTVNSSRPAAAVPIVSPITTRERPAIIGATGPDPQMLELARAAAALAILPAARTVLLDPSAPPVVRDRALYVIERAIRENERTGR